MTLFNSFHTSISGMNAQSKRIEIVADNIANVSTVGYKKASIEFSSMLISQQASSYTSGGVVSNFKYSVTDQGPLQISTNVTDLAIQGDGFFLVEDENGGKKLTRAGEFYPDKDGYLRNIAGYYLTGYKIDSDANNSFSQPVFDAERIRINTGWMSASPSTAGEMVANLPSQAEIVVGDQRPSTNISGSQFSGSGSLTVYNGLGEKVNLDVYYTKIGENQWEVSIFDSRSRSSERFPYTTQALAVEKIEFDSGTGQLANPKIISLSLADGQTISVDLSNTTQLATKFMVVKSWANGSPPQMSGDISISENGRISITGENNHEFLVYQIGIVTARSPDKMIVEPGNAYRESFESGPISLMQNEGMLYRVLSSTLEGSTVDLGIELANMIEAQRNYTANTKVFKTSSDMLELLMSIKN